MAKHLFIVRHAKSDWGFDVSDFDRPLNSRGFKNAPRMAKRLADHAVKPQLLVSSPAKRAITTAQIFAESLDIPVNEIKLEPRIYEALPNTLLQIVCELDNSVDSVAFFGHNPGLTLLVNYLADDSVYNLTTCSIVHIRFDNVPDWASISGGMGTKVWYTDPGKEV
ncbi:SixA phosphatase family protein [Parapedobacter soli]|uniref:SixA phosphatase family protein n=1 Tax=Parapedobacter soli TaxID=416955 RepID=UPI0021C596CF|nr:histidine phosphatase family protein [Parapedobacter soli]